MQAHILKPIAIIVITCITSCSKNISINTAPTGADILLNDKKIGITPLDLTDETLGDPNSAGGYLFSIEKEGYQRIWLWQPPGSDGFKVTINLDKFVLNKSIKGKGDFSSGLSQVIASSNTLLEMQKLLFTNKFDELEEILKKEEVNHNKLGSFYFIKAALAMKKNDQKSALEAITKANQLAPMIGEFVVLKNRLTKTQE